MAGLLPQLRVLVLSPGGLRLPLNQTRSHSQVLPRRLAQKQQMGHRGKEGRGKGCPLPDTQEQARPCPRLSSKPSGAQTACLHPLGLHFQPYNQKFPENSLLHTHTGM